MSIISNEIAIATSTLYPNWYPGRLKNQYQSDKVRGDLTLETCREIKEVGYQLFLVDGGSSDSYIRELESRGINPIPQTEPLLSGSRRQAIHKANITERVGYIVTMEPEKVDFIQHIPKTLEPIANGQCDIVVPRRDKRSFDTYPDYQAEYEQRSNRLWNLILKSQNLTKGDPYYLDAWFGNRIIKNEPDVINHFMKKYRFKDGVNRKLFKITRPDMWANALFIPLISALYAGNEVRSVEVPYRHPEIQTRIEQDDPIFRQKRSIQRKDIITSTIHFIRFIKNDPKCKFVIC